MSFISDLHDLAHLRDHLESEYRIVTAFREGRLRASPHVYNTPDEIDQCFESIVDDSGNLDLDDWLDTGRPPSPGYGGASKKSEVDRSINEGHQ